MDTSVPQAKPGNPTQFSPMILQMRKRFLNLSFFPWQASQVGQLLKGVRQIGRQPLLTR